MKGRKYGLKMKKILKIHENGLHLHHSGYSQDCAGIIIDSS